MPDNENSRMPATEQPAALFGNVRDPNWRNLTQRNIAMKRPRRPFTPVAQVPQTFPRLSTRAFLNTVGAAAVLAGIAMMNQPGIVRAQAGPQTIEVYLTGDPAVDPAAIQNAIDQSSAGDTIVLKATNASSGQFTPFELGSTVLANRGTIKVTKRLTITGEPYSSPMSDRTVINGGFATFFVDTLQATGAVDGPVNFQILESRRAISSFLQYKACDGATITDLTILDVVPAFPTAIVPSGFANSICAENYFDRFQPLYSSDKIRGDFRITRCRIEYLSNTGHEVSYGAMFANTQASLTASDCQVYNYAGGGFECALSTRGMTVTGCEMRATKAALGFGSERFVKGVHAGALSSPVVISNNTISIDATGYNDVPVRIFAVSLPGNTGGAIVENNHINASTNKAGTQGTYGIHFLMTGTNNVTCRENDLHGVASLGSYVTGNNNTFTGNDLTGLATTILGANCIGNSNTFNQNLFGPHSSISPVIWCTGNDNSFSHNDFRITGVKGFNVSSSHVTRPGCILLDNATLGNVVDASLDEFPSDTGPQYDPCTQIVDLSFGGNSVHLEPSPRCTSNQYQQLLHMLSQNEEYRQRKEAIDATLAEALKMIEGW